MATPTKRLKTRPYDPSEFLDDAEGQAELLNDALRSGDAGYIADALGIIARARGMTEIARLSGVKRQSLYEALSEEGNPTLGTVMKVLGALELEFSAHAKQPKQARA